MKIKYIFFVGPKPYTTDKRFMSGAEIKALANIPEEKNLYMVFFGKEDKLIGNDDQVDFANIGWERFEVRDSLFDIVLFVNSQPKQFHGQEISYSQVAELAFGSYDETKGYTVVYSDGPEQNPEGTMSKGKVVYVKHNMRFNVTLTHRS